MDREPEFNQARTDSLLVEIKRAIQNEDKELFNNLVESSFGRDQFWSLAMRNNLVSFDTFFDAKYLGGKRIQMMIDGTIDRSKRKLDFWLTVDWRDGHWVVTEWSDRNEPIFDEAEMDRLMLSILQAFQRRDKRLFDEFNKSRTGENWWNTMLRDDRIPKSFNGQYVSGKQFKMEMVIEDDEGDKVRNFDMKVDWGGDHWIITDWIYKRQ